jgi:hypothetical protein
MNLAEPVTQHQSRKAFGSASCAQLMRISPIGRKGDPRAVPAMWHQHCMSYPRRAPLASALRRNRHLLGIGYIQEQSMSGQDVLITATDAGRKALRETS